MNAECPIPERISTLRLELRRYTDPDVQPLFALIEHNREQLRQDFAPLANGVKQPEDAARFIRECADASAAGKDFTFGIWQPSPQSLSGQLRIKNIAWDIPAAELSYFIDADLQRRGFAFEALRAILRLMLEELHFRRVCLRIVANNTVSLLLAEKLGFIREGLHRNEFRCGSGRLHDVYHYSLTDRDGPAAGVGE